MSVISWIYEKKIRIETVLNFIKNKKLLTREVEIMTEETFAFLFLLVVVFVQIWDSNVFCDSFLGQAKLTIDVNNRTVVLSHQLMGRRRKETEKMPGTVTLEIACYNDLLAV